MNFERIEFPLLSLLVFLISAFVSSSVLAEWEIEPSVRTTIGYSDNIELDNDDDRETGFVGEFNPALRVFKDTGRLQVNLEYVMDNFYFFEDSQLDTDHNLDAIARYAVIPNALFINAFGRVDQVLVDNDQQVSVDDFNDTGNTTDEYSYGIGPQFTRGFANYFLVNLSYLYSEQRFDDESAEDGIADALTADLDDNQRHSYFASIGNENLEADRFDWAASYDREEIDFDFGEDLDFTTGQLDAGYQLTRAIQLLGTYGYEDNDLGDNAVLDDDDGSFWIAGIQVGLGEFTSLQVQRADRFFGDYWLGELTVGGPRLVVNASYEEEVDLSGDDDIEFGIDDEADPFELIDNDIGFTVDDRNTASLSKIWEADISYTISKSTIVLSYSNEDDEFLDTGDSQLTETYTAGWVWNLSGITTLSIVGEYQEDEVRDIGQPQEDSEFYDLDVELLRALSPKTDLVFGYSYSEVDSDDENEDFTSNLITAGIEHRF